MQNQGKKHPGKNMIDSTHKVLQTIQAFHTNRTEQNADKKIFVLDKTSGVTTLKLIDPKELSLLDRIKKIFGFGRASFKNVNEFIVNQLNDRSFRLMNFDDRTRNAVGFLNGKIRDYNLAHRCLLPLRSRLVEVVVQMGSVPYFQSLPHLPGEWHMMDKSQVSLGTPSGCAVYALKAISNLLNCQGELDVIAEFDRSLETMAPVLTRCDPAGTAQYDLEEILYTQDYNQHLPIRNDLNPRRFVCDPFDQSPFAIENETKCMSRAEVVRQLFDSQKEKSFAATILGGPETLAIYQRSPAEIYLLDSHKPVITLNNRVERHFEQAYVGRFRSKEELTDFLLRNRFYCEAAIEDTARLQATIIEL